MKASPRSHHLRFNKFSPQRVAKSCNSDQTNLPAPVLISPKASYEWLRRFPSPSDKICCDFAIPFRILYAISLLDFLTRSSLYLSLACVFTPFCLALVLFCSPWARFSNCSLPLPSYEMLTCLLRARHLSVFCSSCFAQFVFVHFRLSGTYVEVLQYLLSANPAFIIHLMN